MIDLSIIIVNWNTCALLRDCLHSVLASAVPLSVEIILVDNGSTDGSAEMLKQEFGTTRLIQNKENTGFARASNQGIAIATGRYVLLLNSDTVVKPRALAGLVAFLDSHAEVGVVGPRLLKTDGELQEYAFGNDPSLGYLLRRGLTRLLFKRALHDWGTNRVQSVDWVSGACLMARRAAIDQVGLLDENVFLYFEDNDWCLRFRRAGWQVFYNPQVEIIHLGGQSLAQNPAARRAYYRSLDHFYAKHYGPLARWILRLSLMPYRWLVRN